MRDTRKQFLISVLVVLGMWRVYLLGLSAKADYFFIDKANFDTVWSIAAAAAPKWQSVWANFDGVHYLTIAQDGYLKIGLVQAFFPVFPMLIRFITAETQLPYLTSGLIVSHLSWLLMIGAWLLLLKEVTNVTLMRRHWWLILLFPTSFFWVSIYTESLFMALVFFSLWCGIKGQWWWAALAVTVATATRVTGVFLIPALWYEWYYQHTKRETAKPWSLLKAWPIPVISLGGVGLASYMWYLARHFRDPLYFFHVQSEFGGGRQESIVLLPQVFWRYIKIIATARPINWSFYAYLQELIVATSSLIVLWLASKKIRPSIVVFSWLAWLLPTLTGTFSSMPRYILACPALLIMVVLMVEQLYDRRRWLYWLVICLATVWLSINTLLFIQGYWVA